MQVIYNCSGECLGPKAVGLGNFDGLHLGHMTLINTLIKEARSEGIRSIVYTFKQHPENVLVKDRSLPLLTSRGKKIELLSGTGLDLLYFDEFDEQYSMIEPEDFVRDILVERLEARIVVAGFNYRYGHKGKGGLELLEELGNRYGYKLIVIPPVRIDGEVVSSTLIRDLLIAGNIQTAAKFLGRNYSLTGTVRPATGEDRPLVFRRQTFYLKTILSFRRGVYLTKTKIDGTPFNSISNIGIKPTFGDAGQVTVETHILDYSNDIYGKNIELFFIDKIRDEMKFSSVEQLKEQVARDISLARHLHNH